MTEQTLVRLQSLLDQARKALEEGKAKPALALYRKCLLEGKSSPAFSQSKFLEIYETLSTLTEVDPATKRILESHRRSYQERWQADNSDSHSFIQWLVLNQVLDKTQETVAVFDEHKEKRGGLTFYPKILFDALHRDKRYKDAVDVFGYHGHRHVLEAHLAAVQERPDQLPHGEALQVINKTMQGVEALAGAGQRERALELAERLMEIYPIPEVRDQIKNRLEQAGETRLASLVNQSELKKREGPAR